MAFSFSNIFSTKQQALADDSMDPNGYGNRYAKGLSLLNRAGSMVNTGMGLYANRVASSMAANRLNMSAMWQQLQASNIETNAAEQSNAIRNELLNNMASTNAFFAARGFDVSSAEDANIVSRRRAGNDLLNLRSQSKLDAIAMRAAAAQTRSDASVGRAMGRFERAGIEGDLFKQGVNFVSGLRGLL
ncbi:hypothetical protein [Candidatus Odyssella acanthamoebae]|uniref:Flagellin N-terminal domain-containing protein n=1 Tax=Candidatus Odyssella acanthamoebae TaxID=91604 RepID=A0A077ARU7_9PROT|nr:hypothetical protein [Candidatus Paracaedibacter acanthamoebae]AIK95912.1 hypothetical protein ID47_02940 [Candidatus Paracaedibacter acanthamoebae]